MPWSRMTLFGALAMLAIVWIGVPMRASAAPAAAPPDGSYAFTVVRAGLKSGDSAVTVRRTAASIAVHEVETFVAVNDTVDETLDSGTLMPQSYVSSFPLTSEVGITAHLAFYSGGARETVDGTSGATDFRLENGTTHIVVIDGAMMAGFLFLPAQVKALSLNSFTVLSPSRADTYNCRIDPSASPARPGTVPAADASLTVDGTSPAGNVHFVEWFDPKTMVVDEVDVPANQVTIARVRSK
jgi:hypothetical protein